MITKKVINQLYKQFNKRPKSIDKLDIALLFEAVSPVHGIEIENDELIINSVSADSPFHRLPLMLIHAIVKFERVVAIVLSSSILFLSRKADCDCPVRVHIKPLELGATEKLMAMLKIKPRPSDENGTTCL